MTITADRQKVLDFSDPYYYTPAQMAASTASGITTLDGLAGKTVCVGEATTYLDWLKGKKLDFGTLSPTDDAARRRQGDHPEDRRRVPAAWGAGRNDFEGWLSSSTTVEGAIKAGLPLDQGRRPGLLRAARRRRRQERSGSDATSSPRVNQIVADMHADGTLSAHVREVVRARPDPGATQ